ncbi:MAG: LD-carboxypeptidase [Anaerovorax sp.]
MYEKPSLKNVLKRPMPLKVGDSVALIAPSSPVTCEKLQLSVNSVKLLGLHPVVFPCCHLSHGYLAGADTLRAKDVNHAFADSKIKGVFCLRGGYGVSRILDQIDFQLIKKNPKVFLGYSDITGLHTAINQLCKLVTFHGPMPTRGWDTLDDFSLNSLKHHLFTTEAAGLCPMPSGEKTETLFSGTTQGIITGGNLSLLAATLGSPYEIDTKGKLLFIEDTDEKPYRLDKALSALALAGKFKDCAGIILGTWANCTALDEDGQPGGSLTLHEIFEEVVVPYKKPTINNFRAGHIYPQLTIPLGTMVSLDASKGTVTFL